MPNHTAKAEVNSYFFVTQQGLHNFLYHKHVTQGEWLLKKTGVHAVDHKYAISFLKTIIKHKQK